jgi:hypothetical protein
MIKFDDAINMMRDAKAPYVRIMDARGKKVYEFSEYNNVEATIDALEKYRSALENMGRLSFVVADDKIKASNWQNAYHWDVVMTGSNSTQQNASNGHMNGYMSIREVELTNQLHRLQMEMDFDKRLREMQPKNEGFNIGELFNLLPLVMDIDPKKIQAMNAMRGITGNQPVQGIAGTPQVQEQSNLSVQMTEQEIQAKLNGITKSLITIINTEGIGIDKIEKLINALAVNPSLVDKALLFI